MVYSLTDNYNRGLDSAILTAIIQSKHLSLKKILRQAMAWGRVDIASDALMAASFKEDKIVSRLWHTVLHGVAA